MHESHVVQAVLAQVLARAGSAGVAQVHLALDESAGFDAESVRLHFEELSLGTPAAGAQLTIRSLPGRVFCPACNAESDRVKGQYACPKCQSSVRPAKGREALTLENLILASGVSPHVLRDPRKG